VKYALAVIDLFLTVYTWIIILRCILSFLPDVGNPLTKIINVLTDPVVLPLRKLFPVVGGMDFSPMVAFILIQMLQRLVIANLFHI
jgi:YggT family protein